MSPEFVFTLSAALRKQLIGSNLMSQFCFIVEESKKAGAFDDPRYIPFYYYLGKQLNSKHVVEIGFRLGLCSGAFLKGCPTVENLLVYQEHNPKVFYSPRIALKNVKKHYREERAYPEVSYYYGLIEDEGFHGYVSQRDWDLVMINEESSYDRHLFYLEYMWDKLVLGGLITMDYVNSHEAAGKAFKTFCKAKNREPIVIATRYGTGMVER